MVAKRQNRSASQALGVQQYEYSFLCDSGVLDTLNLKSKATVIGSFAIVYDLILTRTYLGGAPTDDEPNVYPNYRSTVVGRAQQQVSRQLQVFHLRTTGN